jgi:transcriptional regulator of acetoin/glycerol metabolism
MILTSGNQLELERAMSGIVATAPPISPASMEQISRVFTVGEMEELERANIMRALDYCGGKVSGESGAARLLGIPASTLNSRMKALRVERPKD